MPFKNFFKSQVFFQANFTPTIFNTKKIVFVSHIWAHYDVVNNFLVNVKFNANRKLKKKLYFASVMPSFV